MTFQQNPHQPNQHTIQNPQPAPQQPGQPRTGQPRTGQAPSNPETAFRPERMSSGSRTGIRTVIAIVAALAVIVPLSIGGTMFARALQTHYYEHSDTFTPSDKGLLVDVPVGVVSIGTTSDSEVKVELAYTGTKQNPDLKIDTAPDGRSVVSVSRVSAPTFGPSDDVRLSIDVPEAVAATMALETRSKVSAFVLDGQFDEVRASSDVGGIDAENLSTRSLTVKTKTGAVSLGGRHKTVDATADIGSISSEKLTVTDRLTAATETGSIDLDLSTEALPAGGIDLATNFGSVELRVPKLTDVRSTDAEGYTVDTAGSSTADISIDTVKDTNGKTVVPIAARTSSGSITVGYLSDSDVDDADPDATDDGS